MPDIGIRTAMSQIVMTVALAMSALPSRATVEQTLLDVSKVPIPAVSGCNKSSTIA